MLPPLILLQTSNNSILFEYTYFMLKPLIISRVHYRTIHVSVISVSLYRTRFFFLPKYKFHDLKRFYTTWFHHKIFRNKYLVRFKITISARHIYIFLLSIYILILILDLRGCRYSKISYICCWSNKTNDYNIT